MRLTSVREGSSRITRHRKDAFLLMDLAHLRALVSGLNLFEQRAGLKAELPHPVGPKADGHLRGAGRRLHPNVGRAL